MSENLKLRLDSPSGETQPDRLSRASAPASTLGPGPDDTGPADEAESQMRKALGLLGESSRHRSDGDRSEQTPRMGDRFNGGLHRRRFVQDGDIPVTVLRRDQGYEPPVHRGASAPSAPTTSRLQRTEAALAAETMAREKAERSLADTQSVVRDLQTKIGHAELAKTEAIEALRRERETIAQLRAECLSSQEQLQEALEQARAAERIAHSCQEQLADERQARKSAEKALRTAESARDAAEQLVRALSDELNAPRRAPAPYVPPVPVSPAPRSAGHAPEQPRRARAIAEPDTVGQVQVRRGRHPETVAAEPEPVKWWLNTKPNGKKR